MGQTTKVEQRHTPPAKVVHTNGELLIDLLVMIVLCTVFMHFCLQRKMGRKRRAQSK